MLSDFLSFLRRADWLNRQRIRAYSLILLVMTVAAAVIGFMLSPGLIDPTGKPIGTDFMSFYAASRLALDGNPALVWDIAAHQSAQNDVFGKPLGYWAFFYPPPYLLVCLPLALVSYGPALWLWSAAGFAACVSLLKKWLADIDAPIWIPVLALPALWINLGNGQNAALITALWLGGVLLMERRPFTGGWLLGLLVIKPHLAIAIPFVLMATGRWQAFIGAGLGALSLCLISFWVFGAEAWLAFMDSNALARLTLEQGLVDPAKMQSLFAAAKLWQLPNPAAYALHIAAALIALTLTLITLRQVRPDIRAAGAAMCALTLCLTPFLLDYDLLLLAIPAGWLLAQGLRSGFLDWEKAVIATAFIAPLGLRALAQTFALPLGPAVTALVLWAVLRRLKYDHTRDDHSAAPL